MVLAAEKARLICVGLLDVAVKEAGCALGSVDSV
jgi:hypothetical protein